MSRRELNALALGLLCAACHRAAPRALDPPEKPAALVVRPALALITGQNRALAFELSALGSGALLAWARPAGGGEEIMLQELDAYGGARGGPRRAAKSANGAEVSELALGVNDARRAGLVWIESSAHAARTLALSFSLDGPIAGEPSELARPDWRATTARGRLAASSSGARVRIFYESGPSPCVDGAKGPCTGYDFRELGAGSLARRSPWLSVPGPCVAGAVSCVTLDGRFFYAMCSRGDDATTRLTAFSVNQEPEYARADQVLLGCATVGMTAIDAATALLVGDCAGNRRGARLSADGEAAKELALDDLSLECDGERAVIRGRDWGLPLESAHDRLEPVLPAAIAAPFARAVATGRALLIASPNASGIALERRLCERGVLVREAQMP